MPRPTWRGRGVLESVGVTFAGLGRAAPRQQIPNSLAEPLFEEEAPVAEAVIVDAVRTARGKRKGSTASAARGCRR